MTNETEILNLVYRYAECIDRGRIDALTDLFSHAKFKLMGYETLQDQTTAIGMLKAVVKIYPDGTPRTKHLVTNPILEVDEANNTASCRSSYTVLQATETMPLQVIAAGRYDDRFERVDGKWRFTFRDYTLFDFAGMIGNHLVGF